MAGWPFEAVIAALFVIVMGRSHAIYWLGRGVSGGTSALATRVAHGHDTTPGGGVGAAEDAAADDPGGRQDRIRRMLTSPTARRGLTLVHRWGPFAVTLAYLTVGLQSAVFAGAGLLRMPYLRFTLASVPGSIAWAFVWGTVGLGAVWAAVALAAESPWALAGVLVLIAALVTAVVLRRRRTARRSSSAVADAIAPGAGRPADAPVDERV